MKTKWLEPYCELYVMHKCLRKRQNVILKLCMAGKWTILLSIYANSCPSTLGSCAIDSLKMHPLRQLVPE